MVFIDTRTFVADQTPNYPAPPTLQLSTTLLAYQLGNIYLLLGLLGVGLLYTTAEPKVIRNYLLGSCHCVSRPVSSSASRCNVLARFRFSLARVSSLATFCTQYLRIEKRSIAVNSFICNPIVKVPPPGGDCSPGVSMTC